MNEDSVVSADFKVDKNGRRYRAKVRHIKGTDTPVQGAPTDVQEASYVGNIGIMELAKFHREATPEARAHFHALLKKKQGARSAKEEKSIANSIWDHIQKTTGVKLHMNENIEHDHILNSLAYRDINASIKNGEVHIHERGALDKAKRIVKNLGLNHKVVQGKLNEELELDEAFIKEMSTATFNGLVKGYIQHKRRAKAQGFSAMPFSKFHATVKKMGAVSEEAMEENKIVVPMLKPRDPNYLTLMRKKNAAGKHRDKKREAKSGIQKHNKQDE